MKNKLYITFFCILMVVGTNHAKGAIAAWPHSDEHLQKYAQNLEFDASVRLGDFGMCCSSSRVKITDDDPVDFYITAAHCIPEEPQAFFDERGVNIVMHPRLDLAIFTTGEQSNKPKYPLYTGNLNDLVGKTLTSVGFGRSMLDETNSDKRQAYDATIGSIRSISMWDWLWNENNHNILRSTLLFTSYLNKKIEDNPTGMSTPGDSGGSLLVKEKSGYKLAGTTSTSMYPWSNRPVVFWSTNWAGIDLDFIESAKEKLLAKMAVYAYPSQPKAGSPIISFSLSNSNSLDKQRSLEMNGKHFIGYAYKNAELIVLVEGEESFNIPIKLGRTNFICQLAQKHYFIEVTIEQAAEGKGFIVKGTILNEEKDRCVVPNLADELMTNNNEHWSGIPSVVKIKPIYYSLSNIDDLPLEVSFHSYLLNKGLKSLIDIGWLENKEILGYSDNNYDIGIRLNGRELKTLHNTEISKDINSFYFHYAGNTYSLCFQKSEGFNEDRISLGVQKFSENLLYDSIESMTATAESFIPVDVNPSYVRADNTMLVQVQLIKGAALYDGYYNTTSQYAKKGSYLQLTIDNQPVNNWSLDQEGCHFLTYKDDGILYLIEVNIQKLNDPEEHYSVSLTLKKLNEELVPINEGCESAVGGIPIEYSLTDSSKAIASDLNLHIVLDNMFPKSSLPGECIGYGNEHSIARIFSNGTELGQFTLSRMGNCSIEFEKNGKSYSMSLKVVFEKNPWRILLDVNEIQEGGSFMTLMNWFK